MKIAVNAVVAVLLALALGSGSRAAAPALPADTGLVFSMSPATLARSCDAAIAAAKSAMKKILAAPTQRAGFATLQAVENAEADFNDATIVQTGAYDLAPDKAVRDASMACNQKVSDFQVALAADPRIYAIAVRVAALGDAKTAADRKLDAYYIEEGKRTGAGLSPAQRRQVTALFDKLMDLERDFEAALNEDKTTIVISAFEAASLPQPLRATFATSSGGYVVPVNESTYDEFMTTQTSAAARKRFAVAYANRGGIANVARLQQAVKIRDRIAHLLGYSSWAAYQLDAKMAKTPQRVERLLTTVSTKLLPKANQEVAVLAALKRRSGDAGPFASWDYPYYENMLVKSRYHVDEQTVREYFPIDHVIANVLQIYQRLLGVTFAEITPAVAWAPGVREFSIADAASGRPIGWFFLDLYPRPGKFEHFANFPIRPGRVLPDGSYQKPISAIVGNWPVPAAGQPALLSHEEVITFFHEFGHLMHSTLSIAPYETLYGTAVRPDFVEAPSQMLENFMWQPSILKQVSSNYKTGDPLPDALIAKMIALKHVNDGMAWSTQAFYAQYDMTIHSSGPAVDVDATWFALKKKMTPFPSIPGTHPEAGFSHLMGGYDAGYYGYLWSKVYAQDIFTRFAREGLENPAVGMAYRKDILEPGATIEPDVMVQNFLGRPVSPAAFYEDLGIHP
jgi:thimet oligopeptidase